MNTITLLNGIKSMFSSLGAKTSDSNYAVGLYDKTSAEPKGIMAMSSLASVLGGYTWKGWTVIDANTTPAGAVYSADNSDNTPTLYSGILTIYDGGANSATRCQIAIDGMGRLRFRRGIGEWKTVKEVE